MAASFSLIIEDDAGKQIVVPFAKDVITIGRKEGNTIRLTERNVSRFHAKLSKESNHVVVEDLTSFNGVKLNGDRIAGRVEVGAGDVIEIGDYHLELRTAQPSATTTKMGPAGAKSAGIDHATQVEDDEFEGDTQRWDQPVGGAASIPVGAMHTVDERAQSSIPLGSFGGEGDTEKLDLDKLAAMVGAGQSAPPPAPLTPAQSWPPPPRSAAPPSLATSDLEATVRQPPAAPAPPPVLTQPAPAAAAVDDELDATQDMPLPAVAQARANLLAQGVGVRREAPAVEQTEQMRMVPSLQVPDDLVLPRLVVLNTIFSGSTFALRAMENVLGRTDDNDIVLEHRSVSRNHAKLVREGERVRILDLKSANGVLVNGEEVEQHVLKSGDVIELGRVRIRFVAVGERFVVPADEIERARIADANGDDVEENSGLSANKSPRAVDTTAKKPLALYAILAVLVLMVVVLGAIVLSGGKDPAPTTGPATTVGEVDTVIIPAAAAASEGDAPVNVVPPNEKPTKLAKADVVAAAAATAQDELAAERAAARERDKPREPAAAAAAAPVDNEKQFEEARRALFSNDAARSVKLLEELVKKNAREPRFQLALASGYKQLGQTAKARQHYDAFLQVQPTGADAEKVRGILKDLR